MKYIDWGNLCARSCSGCWSQSSKQSRGISPPPGSVAVRKGWTWPNQHRVHMQSGDRWQERWREMHQERGWLRDNDSDGLAKKGRGGQAQAGGCSRWMWQGSAAEMWGGGQREPQGEMLHEWVAQTHSGQLEIIGETEMELGGQNSEKKGGRLPGTGRGLGEEPAPGGAVPLSRPGFSQPRRANKDQAWDSEILLTFDSQFRRPKWQDCRNWGVWIGVRKEVDESMGGGMASGPGYSGTGTLHDGILLTAGNDWCVTFLWCVHCTSPWFIYIPSP